MEKKFSTLFLFILIFQFYVLPVVYSVPFYNCAFRYTVTDVQIGGCNENEDCVIFMGTHVNVSFTFNSGIYGSAYTTLNHDITLDVIGTHTTFNLTAEPANACEVITCPVKANYTGIFSGQMYVSTYSQPFIGGFRWILTDDTGGQHLCFGFTTVIARS